MSVEKVRNSTSRANDSCTRTPVLCSPLLFFLSLLSSSSLCYLSCFKVSVVSSDVLGGRGGAEGAGGGEEKWAKKKSVRWHFRRKNYIKTHKQTIKIAKKQCNQIDTKYKHHLCLFLSYFLFCEYSFCSLFRFLAVLPVFLERKGGGIRTKLLSRVQRRLEGKRPHSTHRRIKKEEEEREESQRQT